MEGAQTPQFSIVCCTYNPRQDYFVQVLKAVLGLNCTGIASEFLIIDNNSNVFPSDLVRECCGDAVRVVHEPRPGLTYARERGVLESRGEWIVFVDDDNVIAGDYLQQCSLIIKAMPQLGVLGSGSIDPVFEIECPDWLSPHLGNLALRSNPRQRWTNGYEYDAFPCGAGLVVRRDLILEHFNRTRSDPLRMALGRTGKSLASAEDTDIVMSILDLGKGTGVFPELRLKHLIPRARMTRRYLNGLAFSLSKSLMDLQQLRDPVPLGLVEKLRLSMLCVRNVILSPPHRMSLAFHSQRGRMSSIWTFTKR